MYSTKKEITEEYIVKRINILKCGAQRTLEKKMLHAAEVYKRSAEKLEAYYNNLKVNESN
jgi:hypothetical protein